MAPRPLVIGGKCNKGHLLTHENVSLEKTGRVRCRTCDANKRLARQGKPLSDTPPPFRVLMERGGHCIAGHFLSDDLVYEYPDGKIVCKLCRHNSNLKRKGLEVTDTLPIWGPLRTECPQGHPYDEENTYNKPDGSRGCKKCTYIRNREKNYRDKYGITVEDYDRMFELQNGCCAICLEEFVETGHVDHDHATGAVRELLCISCNNMLGRAKDNPGILLRAANYINKHKQ